MVSRSRKPSNSVSVKPRTWTISCNNAAMAMSLSAGLLSACSTWPAHILTPATVGRPQASDPHGEAAMKRPLQSAIMLTTTARSVSS